MDFNGCDPAHMVASFHSGDVVIYDLETSQNTLVLKGQGEDGESHTLTETRQEKCFTFNADDFLLAWKRTEQNALNGAIVIITPTTQCKEK